jgi:hypothetical protein
MSITTGFFAPLALIRNTGRLHTVHDPVRWKYAAIGDFYPNGVRPPATGKT